MSATNKRKSFGYQLSVFNKNSTLLSKKERKKDLLQTCIACTNVSHTRHLHIFSWQCCCSCQDSFQWHLSFKELLRGSGSGSRFGSGSLSRHLPTLFLALHARISKPKASWNPGVSNPSTGKQRVSTTTQSLRYKFTITLSAELMVSWQFKLKGVYGVGMPSQEASGAVYCSA